MKKPVIIIIVIILVAAAGYGTWAMLRNDSSDDKTETTQSSDEPVETENNSTDTPATETEDNAVVYNDDGFSPATITVPVGTKVTWTNESSGEMWVGSDPHPVHTDYSAFDQKSVGDSYSFTFSEAGTYHYHNHQNPNATGTVIVE